MDSMAALNLGKAISKYDLPKTPEGAGHPVPFRNRFALYLRNMLSLKPMPQTYPASKLKSSEMPVEMPVKESVIEQSSGTGPAPVEQGAKPGESLDKAPALRGPFADGASGDKHTPAANPQEKKPGGQTPPTVR